METGKDGTQYYTTVRELLDAMANEGVQLDDRLYFCDDELTFKLYGACRIDGRMMFGVDIIEK